MYKVIILAIFQCLLLTAGNVCFKFAVRKMNKFEWSWTYFLEILTNWWLLATGICMISVTVLWGFILRNFPFSIAYPMTAFAYIFGMLAAVFIFQESVPLTRWVGVGLIVLGVFFIAK